MKNLGPKIEEAEKKLRSAYIDVFKWDEMDTINPKVHEFEAKWSYKSTLNIPEIENRI